MNVEAWTEEGTRAACKRLNGRAIARAAKLARHLNVDVAYAVTCKSGARAYPIAPSIVEPSTLVYVVTQNGSYHQWKS